MNMFGRLRAPADAPPTEGHMPGYEGATGWLNSPPLTDADLRGNVVLTDFWTYTCINWLRTLGYVRAWADRYRDHGLVVVGAHTPEFPFEREVENVKRAAREMAIEYPIAIDSDYAVWDAFANRYWPAVYIADAEGRIRHHQFGEGGYEECERVIQKLLRDSGRDGIPDDTLAIVPGGIEAQADWTTLESPETYLGYGLSRSFASPGGARLDEPRDYDVPEGLRRNQWGLAGAWTIEDRASVLNEAGGQIVFPIEDRASVLNEAGGQIVFRFHSRDVHLVMGPRPRESSVPFRVMIDGEPPDEAHGLDIDADGNGSVGEQRLYQLIRQPDPIADRTFEITFMEPGVEAYVFTFG